MGPPILSTARLRLRGFADSDFGWLHPIASDPAVSRFTDWGPNAPEDTRTFLVEAIAAGQGPRVHAVDPARRTRPRGGCSRRPA